MGFFLIELKRKNCCDLDAFLFDLIDFSVLSPGGLGIGRLLPLFFWLCWVLPFNSGGPLRGRFCGRLLVNCRILGRAESCECWGDVLTTCLLVYLPFCGTILGVLLVILGGTDNQNKVNLFSPFKSQSKSKQSHSTIRRKKHPFYHSSLARLFVSLFSPNFVGFWIGGPETRPNKSLEFSLKK